MTPQDFSRELASTETPAPAPKSIGNTKKKRPGPRSFRLTAENQVRFAQIHQILKLDNQNLTMNRIIETYAEYLKYQPRIEGMKAAMGD